MTVNNSYLLGVDIGTYSSKGVLVALDGTVVASHVVEHEMDMPKPGHFEHDADKVWWHDFVVIAKAILQETKINPKDIIGIGTSAIGSCVLPVDEQGNALRPGILYGIDTRANDENVYLEQVIADENISELQGLSLTSQASGPKILWIRKNEPDVYAKARWFLTSQAYIVLKLTGKATIDIYTAGGFTPLFDSRSFSWLKSMEKHITEVERMPNVYWSHEVVGKVTKEAAEITGLAEGTPVVAGTTDAASEAISAGLAYNDDMMIMFGSTIFFIQKTEKLVKPKKFWASNFLSEGTYAYLGGMSAAGSLTRWFRSQLGYPEVQAEEQGGPNAYKALAELAETSSPGANGLIALPYFEGERTPIHDAKAQGVFFGLNFKHTRADMYRALLESVAYGIKHNIDEMRNEGVSAKRILAVGGGTKNLPWMQIVADVVGITLNIPEQIIGASYGDAFLAGLGVKALNKYEDIDKWVRMKHVIKPRAEMTKMYDKYYQVYRELYTATKPLMHRFSDLKQQIKFD